MPINEWLTQIFDGRVSHTAKDVSAKIQSELHRMFAMPSQKHVHLSELHDDHHVKDEEIFSVTVRRGPSQGEGHVEGPARAPAPNRHQHL
jgi:hypothetical protein